MIHQKSNLISICTLLMLWPKTKLPLGRKFYDRPAVFESKACITEAAASLLLREKHFSRGDSFFRNAEFVRCFHVVSFV